MDSSRSGYVSLAELGDELRKKNPDMMKKVEALQGPETSLPKIMEDLYDLLPYSWSDLDNFEHGVEQILAGNFAQAVESLADLLRETPDCYPASHLMGFACGCLQKYKQELECYRKAAKVRPDYPQVYFDMAMSHLLQGKEKKAFSEFKRVIALSPDFSTVDFWLHLTFDRLGRGMKTAKPGENGGRESDKAVANGCCLLGLAYLEYGKHIEARHAFKKAVNLLPDFAEAQYQLGAIHIKRLRNPKRAGKYLERAEQLFLQQGDLHRATLIQQLCRPGEKVADNARAAEDWLKEGLRLQQLERYQGAVDAYKMAIKFQPNFVDAYYNLGVAYGSLEDTGLELIHKAIWAFKQVIQVKPDFIHAYSALGASYMKQAEYGEALKILSEALQLEKKESSVFYYLGMVSRMTGNIEGAVDYFKAAVDLNPHSVQSNFYLGLTLMEMEKCPEACDVLQEVVQIKPDFAEVHFMLGSLYTESIKDPDKAVTHLKKAEKLFVKLGDNLRLSHVRQMLTRQSI
ncbi:MAG: peptide transporter [Nitrospinaceae bacterium]|nr:MAG: peptide transporter [Nitrospinaceae bacterium]